jgi:hypothetical protein
MKKFAIIFISLVVFLGWLSPAIVSALPGQAEKLRVLMQNTTPAQRAHFEDMWMKRELKLSRNQAVKVSQINLRSANRMQSIFDSTGGKLRMFRQVMKARDAKDMELRNVLTGKQFSMYKTKKEEMWQKMQTMRKMK